jgi:hypothetical protein
MSIEKDAMLLYCVAWSCLKFCNLQRFDSWLSEGVVPFAANLSGGVMCVFPKCGQSRQSQHCSFFPFDHKHVGHLSLSLSPFSSNGYFNDTRKKMVKQGC